MITNRKHSLVLKNKSLFHFCPYHSAFNSTSSLANQRCALERHRSRLIDVHPRYDSFKALDGSLALHHGVRGRVVALELQYVSCSAPDRRVDESREFTLQ